jgi:hypothetical protein
MSNEDSTKKMTSVLLAAWLGVGLWLAPADVEGGTVFSVDLNELIEKADLVLTGTLVPAPLPYRVLDKKFYRIMPITPIAGGFVTNSVLFVPLISDWGPPVKIESNMCYMLFLQKVDLLAEGLSKEINAYRLVEDWKGILSLDKAACERRSLRKIAKDYGIVLDDRPQELIDAIKASVRGTVEYMGKDEKNENTLSDGAAAIYEALSLKPARAKSPILTD